MSLIKYLKDLFGSPKAKKIAENVEVFARENFEKAKVNAAPYLEKTEEYIEVAKEKATPYIEKAEDYLETAKEKATPYLEKVEIVAGETKEKVIEAFENIKEKVTDFVDEAHQKKEQTIDFIEIDDEETEISKTTEFQKTTDADEEKSN